MSKKNQQFPRTPRPPSFPPYRTFFLMPKCLRHSWQFAPLNHVKNWNSPSEIDEFHLPLHLDTISFIYTSHVRENPTTIASLLLLFPFTILMANFRERRTRDSILHQAILQTFLPRPHDQQSDFPFRSKSSPSASRLKKLTPCRIFERCIVNKERDLGFRQHKQLSNMPRRKPPTTTQPPSCHFLLALC